MYQSGSDINGNFKFFNLLCCALYARLLRSGPYFCEIQSAEGVSGLSLSGSTAEDGDVSSLSAPGSGKSVSASAPASSALENGDAPSEQPSKATGRLPRFLSLCRTWQLCESEAGKIEHHPVKINILRNPP